MQACLLESASGLPHARRAPTSRTGAFPGASPSLLRNGFRFSKSSNREFSPLSGWNRAVSTCRTRRPLGLFSLLGKTGVRLRLDACAAPGGKSILLWDMAAGTV